jgi:serine/threonine protein kinase
MYLRDARHVDKFLYTLRDETFYEPYEARYEPSPEYMAVVTELLPDLPGDWMMNRDGFWVHVHPKEFPLPVQGWKIHVSATLENGKSILERVARIVLAHNVPFKFALDRNILSLFSSKKWNRGGSGKFITIYPTDLPSFQRLLEDLYTELRAEEGPYILSDKRYKDCRVLYYRYGGIKRTTQIDIMGKEVPILISPQGEAVPDIRTPYFEPASWVTDPFPDDESEDEDMTLNGGRYLVKQALTFSNSGGVYVAEDRNTGKEVVIKEARPHTLMDTRKNDAIGLLKKEQQILELLGDTSISPSVVESFYDWENFFLAQEYVPGLDLRQVMLTQSPFTRVNPSLADTTAFYDVYKKIFSSFARAVSLLHERNIVFGDLSANNIKIDPSTFAVRLIDFEGAFRVGIDEPTFLYTPGFRDALSVRTNHTPDFADDRYGLAAIMFYTIFPIHALSSLRSDLYDTALKIVLDDLGWSKTEVFTVINGLVKNEITCARACELLDAPVELQSPHYSENLAPDFCASTVQEMGDFILTNIRAGGTGALFPCDPFMYQTNSLSLGFGACGVLYALRKCGFEIPAATRDELEQELDKVRPEKLPPGLLTGASGIAWSLSELGFEERAAKFMDLANRSPLLQRHHSYLYGMAGIGMANLHFYLRTRHSGYLETAIGLADSLLQMSQESDIGRYWTNDGVVHLGYGYGQSGVALFFLRLFQLTGSEKFLSEGTRALEFDLSHGVEIENGVLSFARGPSDFTFDPYLEEGSAGIARVAMRYGRWNDMEKILADVHRKYARYAGLLYGLGSFIDVLADAYLFSNEAKFLEMAKRPIAGLQDIYLLKRAQGAATPGDGLFRISCDYATGIAGVLRALYRQAHLDQADFVLDEITSVAQDGHEPVSVAAIAAVS